MSIPDTLRHKMELWRANARVFRENAELFSEISWVEVFLGQNLVPRSYHPLVDALEEERIANFLDNVRSTIKRCVEVMPTHAAYVAQQCAIDPKRIAVPQAARAA
jgi:tryptophan halogenase